MSYRKSHVTSNLQRIFGRLVSKHFDTFSGAEPTCDRNVRSIHSFIRIVRGEQVKSSHFRKFIPATVLHRYEWLEFWLEVERSKHFLDSSHLLTSNGTVGKFIFMTPSWLQNDWKGPTRVNLSAYFQKIFGAEKELLWFLAQILTQKEALQQWAIHCLIASNNRYQSFFGAHWRTKLFRSRIFGAGQQRDYSP